MIMSCVEKSMKKIRAIHFPYWTKGNPYQDLLTNNLEDFNIEVIREGTYSILTTLQLTRKYWRPDILHLHWQRPLILGSSRIKTLVRGSVLIFELWTAARLGIKVVWTMHNLQSHTTIYRDLQRFFTYKIAAASDAIIVHCERAQMEAIRNLRIRATSKVHIIPHGHYIDSYENLVSRSEARCELGLSESAFVFLFLGLIKPYKGVQDLIREFHHLPDKNCRLIIAGKPESEDLAQNIEDNIGGDRRILTSFGFVPNRKIQVYMNAADVVVFPYRNILTSGGALLAMSFGKPVLAPNLGCIPELLKDSGNFLFDTNGTRDLLSALERAVISKNLSGIGARNYEKAKTLDWKQIARMTARLYFRLLQV